jgi:threonine/homoserine/homoserine lactone efflux protein
MDAVTSIVVAGITGVVAGFLLSIPLGPISLTILNEGARRGFRWAVMIGLGATAMELVYCFIAFTSFASFFTKGLVKAAMELTSFVFLLYLSIKFMSAKSPAVVPVDLGKAGHRIEEKIEHDFHPHSAFMTGFVRVMGNVGVLVMWVIVAANLISREWVRPFWPEKIACVSGIGLGTVIWFVGLSWVVSRGHGKISPKTLLKMEHLSGVGLLLIALGHGGSIIWQMARHRM